MFESSRFPSMRTGTWITSERWAFASAFACSNHAVRISVSM